MFQAFILQIYSVKQLKLKFKNTIDSPRHLNRLGGTYYRKNKMEKAIAIYKKALAGDLPEKSVEAQPIHLHLGDLLMANKSHKAALGHYRLAQAGKDKRIATLAQTRLNEYEIRSAMSDVKAML